MFTRFSILGLIELTAVVAFVLANDRLFFRGGGDLISNVLVTGGLTGVYLGIRRRSDDRFASVLKSSGIWAAVVTVGNGVPMAMIVSERFRLQEHIEFTWVSTGRGLLGSALILTILGGGFGMLLALVPAAIIARWKHSYSR